jgi:hypothetical protein
MSNPIIVKIVEKIPSRISPIYGLLLGGSLYHSIYNENSYTQAAIAWVTPAVYTGYHVYKNKDQIIDNYLKLIKKSQ